MGMELARGSLEPQSMQDVFALAKVAATTGFFGARTPETAAIVMLTGRELGLSAMQSLRGIYVVQGRPVLSADLMVAVVRKSGLCESWRTEESTPKTCTIQTKRMGEPSVAVKTWTIEDAQRAGLVAKKGTWEQYPAQMLRHRCAADLAREVYPDVLLGVYVEGEIEAIESQPEQAEDSRARGVIESVKMQFDAVVGIESAAGVYVDHEQDMAACGVDSGVHTRVRDLLVGHLEGLGQVGVKSKIDGAIRAEKTKREKRQLPSTIAEAVQSVAPAVESVGLVPKAYDAELSALAPVTVEGVATIWVRHRHAIERLEKGARGMAWKWALEAAAIAGGTKESLTAAVLALTEPQPEPPKGTKRGHGPVSNETATSATVEHAAQPDAVSAQRVELDGWVIQQAYDRDFCGADDRKAWQQYCRTGKRRDDFALMGSLLKRREAFSRRGLWADRYESVVWELGSRMPGGIAAAQKALDTWMAGPSKKAVAA